MTHGHHHDSSPLLGAAIGAIGGIYKSVTTSLGFVTFGGLMETAVYAVVGSALGAIVSYSINHLLKKYFKK